MGRLQILSEKFLMTPEELKEYCYLKALNYHQKALYFQEIYFNLELSPTPQHDKEVLK